MIRDLNNEEMPREKLIKFGAENLTNIELLSIILRTGTKEKNVIELSREILNYFDINQISRKTYDELIHFKGIKKAKASQIVSIFELARRFASELTNNNNNNNYFIKSSIDLYNLVKFDFHNLSNERVMIVLVNSKNKIIRKEFLHFGGINYSLIEIRKILKKVLIYEASGFFLIHNHPSGNSNPSEDDISITNKIKYISIELEIRFLDHIIIGENYYSFLDNELI